MVKKFNKILILLLTIGLSYYAFSMNSQLVTVRLGVDRTITSPLASVLLLTFTIGVLFSAILAAFFSVRAYFREKDLVRRDRRRQALWEDLSKARGLRALEDLNGEHELLRSIIDREPANSLVRLELARNLVDQGKTKEALKVVDATRALEGSQIESLMRAAELHIALGNKTAALDTLSRLLSLTPSQKASTLARDVAESLGKIDEALEYHEQAVALRDTRSTHDEARGQVLNLKKILRDTAGNSADALPALQNFTRQHPHCREGLEELARAEREAGNTDKSTHALIRVGKVANDAEPYFRAAQAFIADRRPDQALATAKLALTDLSGPPVVDAYINIMKVCVALQMYGEVERYREALEKHLGKGIASLSRLQINGIRKVQAYTASLTGDLDSARRTWRELALGEDTEPHDNIQHVTVEADGPSPRLSTP